MKNRKLVITAFLLIAALAIGVGYAALTDTLTIIGNAHIDYDQANKTFDQRIYFSAAEVVEGTGGTGTTEDVVSYSTDDATFTANSLAILNESVTFKYTIKSESNVDAKITIETKKLSGDDNPTNSNTEKFRVDYVVGNEGNLAAGGTLEVTVTVTVIDPVTSATSATFGIELTATSVE